MLLQFSVTVLGQQFLITLFFPFTIVSVLLTPLSSTICRFHHSSYSQRTLKLKQGNRINTHEKLIQIKKIQTCLKLPSFNILAFSLLSNAFYNHSTHHCSMILGKKKKKKSKKVQSASGFKLKTHSTGFRGGGDRSGEVPQ